MSGQGTGSPISSIDPSSDFQILNLGELVNRVKAKLQISFFDTIYDTQIKDNINDAVLTVASEIRPVIRIAGILTESPLLLEDNHLETAEFYIDGKKVGLSNYENVVKNTDVGKPEKYAVLKGKLYTSPLPDTNYSYIHLYYYMPETLVDDSSKLTLPAYCITPVILLASAYSTTILDPAAHDRLMFQYSRTIKAGKTYSNNRPTAMQPFKGYED